MKKHWQIFFCDQDDKYCTITDFLESLPTDGQIKVLKFLELLSDNGPSLRRPYSDILYDGIHELRLRIGKIYARILYFFVYGDFIILQSGFQKNTDRTPDRLVKQAVSYRNHFLENYSKNELKENLNAPI
ncbi:MAG: type II toxin-antitoxin system RelE/ParE family toxin [Candidatus Cloacimonetes bacterium]|nr:type II toxin-antitoxin system RelE/ParE family toxin [Candidatus Cloacimonadota bacterium]